MFIEDGEHMNIRYLIGFIIVILFCFLIFVFKFLDKKSSKEFELTYKINAGIPFRWEYEIEDESVVEFVKSYVIRNDNKGGKVGAPIYTNYVFKGLKKGETVITFKFVNFTENRVDKEEEHRVIVDDDLNISLVKE